MSEHTLVRLEVVNEQNSISGLGVQTGGERKEENQVSNNLFNVNNSGMCKVRQQSNTTLYYHNQIHQKETIHSRNNCLVLENIHYKKKRKEILNNISCVIPSGQLVLILGASGSGKSSLLDIISKRINSDCTGNVEFKGKPLTRKSFQKQGGYVLQDDILLSTDSIHEVLMEASFLKYKHKQGTSIFDIWKMCRERTMQLEDEMGLFHNRNVKIGSETTKGASGGQKKRTSLSIQLINNPDLLLLDEYSSGLDSFTAFEIGKKLQSLAHDQGKTIVATVHQPSSALFSLFDYVMLLSKGRMIYYGPVASVKNYVNQIGYPIPEDTNPADWLLTIESDPYLRQKEDFMPEKGVSLEKLYLSEEESDSIQVDVAIDNKINETSDTILQKRSEWLSNYYTILLSSNKNVITNNTSTSSISTMALSNLSGGSAQPSSSIISSSNLHKEDLANNSIVPVTKKSKIYSWFVVECMKLIVLMWRNLRTSFREPMIIFSELFQALVLGIFCGVLYLKLPFDQQSISDRISAIYFVVLCIGFAPASAVVSVFPLQRELFTREREANLYGTLTYYIAYSLVHSPIEIIFPILMHICSYWLVGYQNQADTFFAFTGILILVQWCSESFGLLIGALFESVEVSALVVSVCLTIWMVFSGFFIPISQIGPWFYPLTYTSFFKYSVHAMAQAELYRLEFTCAATSKALQSANITEYCTFLNGSTLDVSIGGSPEQQGTLYLQNYTTEICRKLDWNQTISTISSFGCYKKGEEAVLYYFDEMPLFANFLVLIGMFVVLRVLIYLSLRFKRWNRK